MSVLVVKAFDRFLSSIDYESKVLSLSNDGVNTTLSVENVLFIRALPDYSRHVFIDGVQYQVLEVDYFNDVVKVKGILLNASIYKVPNPFYIFGTLISAGQELNAIPLNVSLPMIYLNELIPEKRQPKRKNSLTIANMRVAFADLYSNEWNREEHYNIAIMALSKLCQYVEEKLKKGKCIYIDDDEEIDQTCVPKWGKQTRKGNSEKTFNLYLDAIEWRFKLTISKCFKF